MMHVPDLGQLQASAGARLLEDNHAAELAVG